MRFQDDENYGCEAFSFTNSKQSYMDIYGFVGAGFPGLATHLCIKILKIKEEERIICGLRFLKSLVDDC